ncbi:MAG: hypothetical protein GEV03_22065 [Streptosporangiales bacterium]|nr:hypothetical protein [Streptosporangiales bacterium]
MGIFVSALLAGVSSGVPLFLIASGLTLIFGVMGILNFAHGAFFLVGAFVALTIYSQLPPGGWSFGVAVLASGAVVAVLASVCHMAVFRRLLRREEIVGLLGSFALLLVLVGLSEYVWGVNPRTLTMPPVLDRQFRLGSVAISAYDILLLAVGLVVALGLWYMLRGTELGRRARAVAHDRLMASALGVRSDVVTNVVVALGGFLAGLAGGLVAPSVSIDVGLALSFIVASFAIVLIGGGGLVGGALLAALVLGIADSIAVTYVPSLYGYAQYAVIAAMLLARALIRPLRAQTEREQVA